MKPVLKSIIAVLFFVVPSGAQYGSDPEFVFTPNTFDRIGVGTQGVPYGYGYGSYGQLGYQSAYGGGNPHGLGIDDFLRSYRLRPDALLEQSQMQTRQAAELLGDAQRYEADLRGYLSRSEQTNNQINAVTNVLNNIINNGGSNPGPGQNPGNSPGPGAGIEDLRDQALLVIKTHCWDCHGNGASQGGLTLDAFPIMGCEDLKMVLESVVRPDTAAKPRMPMGGDPLSAGEIQILTDYTNAVCSGGNPGTNPPTPPVQKPALTEDRVREIVRVEMGDLEQRITVNVANEIKPSIEKMQADIAAFLENQGKDPDTPKPLKNPLDGIRYDIQPVRKQ